ncbi:MAG: hypothetical protein HFJ13_12040 [Clostridium sp.]|jgi:hypothetical protein|uniref:hypothetical protein n=1 Tax=Clostridium sp. TaxID=1506 RepID=UPI0025BB2AAA|nr:hypothetical protein [Clostridium sp.]MCI9070230.1 hypothetical protein [Clostridium sp.]MCI9304815.1 hypothetical protein [Clostridium sp.]
MAKDRNTKTISFPEYDTDIYELLEKERNASSLVRYLLRCYYGMANPNNFYRQFTPQQNTIEKETVPEVEEEEESALGITNYKDDTNIKALESLMDDFD